MAAADPLALLACHLARPSPCVHVLVSSCLPGAAIASVVQTCRQEGTRYFFRCLFARGSAAERQYAQMVTQPGNEDEVFQRLSPTEVDALRRQVEIFLLTCFISHGTGSWGVD